MSKEQFDTLALKMDNCVRHHVFKSDWRNVLSGEKTMAIGLRLLSGGSYLDFIGVGSGFNIKV